MSWTYVIPPDLWRPHTGCGCGVVTPSRRRRDRAAVDPWCCLPVQHTVEAIGKSHQKCEDPHGGKRPEANEGEPPEGLGRPRGERACRCHQDRFDWRGFRWTRKYSCCGHNRPSFSSCDWPASSEALAGPKGLGYFNVTVRSIHWLLRLCAPPTGAAARAAVKPSATTGTGLRPG